MGSSHAAGNSRNPVKNAVSSERKLISGRIVRPWQRKNFFPITVKKQSTALELGERRRWLAIQRGLYRHGAGRGNGPHLDYRRAQTTAVRGWAVAYLTF